MVHPNFGRGLHNLFEARRVQLSPKGDGKNRRDVAVDVLSGPPDIRETPSSTKRDLALRDVKLHFGDLVDSLRDGPEHAQAISRAVEERLRRARIRGHAADCTPTGSRSSLEELARHLGGISAIMESHFRYEERQLLVVLETLALDADPKRVLGPL